MLDKGNNEFRLFDVYLGSLRRKEDFFTYYFTACLDYIQENNRDVFNNILKHMSIPKGYNTCMSNEEASALLRDKYFEGNKEFSESDKPLNKKQRRIYREFPLPTEINDKKNLYLDTAFFLNSDGKKPIFVGIEGKVWDSSVTKGQLNKYYKSLRDKVLKENQVEIYLFLLSTIDNFENAKNKKNKSAARKEVDDFNEDKTHQECKLILWEEFGSNKKDKNKIFDKVEDKYFTSARIDAFTEIEENRKIEEEKLAKTGGKNQEFFEFYEYFNNEDLKDKWEEMLLFLNNSENPAGDNYYLKLKESNNDKHEKFFEGIKFLLDNPDNLVKVDEPTNIKEDLKNMMEVEEGQVEELKKCLNELITKTMSLNSIIKNKTRNNVSELEKDLNAFKNYEDQKKTQVAFIDNIEDRDIRSFYKRFFFEISEYSKYIQYRYNGPKNLNLWVKPKAPPKPLTAGMTSLLSLGNDQITIPIKK